MTTSPASACRCRPLTIRSSSPLMAATKHARGGRHIGWRRLGGAACDSSRSYDVHGLFMSNWDDEDSYCTSAQDYQDARDGS
jgi:hypothetical protein